MGGAVPLLSLYAFMAWTRTASRLNVFMLIGLG